MKTKEEILKAKFQKLPNGEYNPIHEAMDEYAKQEAIEFYKFVNQTNVVNGYMWELYQKLKSKPKHQQINQSLNINV